MLTFGQIGEGAKTLKLDVGEVPPEAHEKT